MINDKMNLGEMVSAVLTNAKTGEKRVIDEKGLRKEAKYRVEVKVTNLETGEVHTYEQLR